MKFEKLNESNGKGRTIFLCGLITGVGLLIIFNLFLTKAKYKVVDSAKLVNSTINYSNADLNVIAMYVKEEDSSNYEPIEEIPTGNYDIDIKESYCIVKDNKEKIYNVMEYKENKVYIGIDKKGTKCYVYFDKIKPASEKQLADLNLKVSESGCPEIDESTGLPKNKLTNETSTNGYLCEGVDDDGKTYYFRGHKDKVNNWVQMGNTYWRIIRINGDGTIRLIYNGTSTSDTGIAKASVAYNTTYNDNKYVGFMYGSASNNYKSATTNTTKSNILTQLDTLYGTIIPTEYKSLVDENAGFCNDRTPYAATSGGSPETGSHGFGSNTTYYGAYIRVRTDQKPTFKCPKVDLGGGDSVDNLFTTTKSEKGNKALTNPIGLITADEVMYAGAIYGTSNTNYWLHNDSYYWTMSPSYYYYGGSSYQGANVFRVNNDGYLNDGYVGGTAFGVRPVINLKASTKFTTGGNGTSGDAGSSTNPFVVKLN